MSTGKKHIPVSICMYLKYSVYVIVANVTSNARFTVNSTEPLKMS